MAFSIKHPEADRLVRELSDLTGESLTEAVLTALRERLERLRVGRRRRRLADDLQAIGERCSRLPVRDTRPPDEILGYDEHGVPR